MKKFFEEFREGVAQGLGIVFVIWVVSVILEVLK